MSTSQVWSLGSVLHPHSRGQILLVLGSKFNVPLEKRFLFGSGLPNTKDHGWRCQRLNPCHSSNECVSRVEDNFRTLGWGIGPVSVPNRQTHELTENKGGLPSPGWLSASSSSPPLSGGVPPKRRWEFRSHTDPFPKTRIRVFFHRKVLF